jgi:hypothetical protein
VHRAIYCDMAKHTPGACVRVKTRYFEKFKINISTLCRIQTKLSTRKRLNRRSILLTLTLSKFWRVKKIFMWLVLNDERETNLRRKQSHRGYNLHVQACHATSDETWKRGHWVKSKFPFRELSRSINVCIQFMWQKGSTFLATVTPSICNRLNETRSKW